MNDIESFDMIKMFKVIFKNLRFVLIVTVVFGVLVFSYSKFIATEIYKSNISVYVNNSKTLGSGDKVTNSDLIAAQQLVSTYAEIIKSNTVLKKVINDSRLDYTPSQIRQMMKIEAKNETEIFEVTITNANPEHAFTIAKSICKIVPNELIEIVEASSVKIIDYAAKAENPISPNNSRNALLGLIFGMIVSVVWVVLKEQLDVRIKAEEDIEHMFDYPILGAIPDMNKKISKNAYGYLYTSTSDGGK